MQHRNLYQCLVFILLTFAIVVPVWAGAPVDAIKETTDKILAIITDPNLKDPAKAKERRSLIRKAVDERFDWKEMSRRSLARHWLKRTEEEKQAFVSLFGRLLERTYMDKVEDYAGEKVIYAGEVIDGEYGVVEVKIVTTKETEIPVIYKLREKEEDWLVYDISIEGVSLINNYRVQFNNMLARSSYENLVKKLQEKVAEE
ncbi:MAG: ABC transporter substrate-binding protein [Desulfobacteraceae bacterium]